MARHTPGFLIGALLCAGCAPASSPPPPARATIEIVESAPLETTLDHADIPNAAEIWVGIIERAHTSLAFAEFYASESDNPTTSRLAPVIAAIEHATARGVAVRFLADSTFVSKYPEVLERLRVARVDVRIIDFSKIGGGILHAKYFVADGEDVFIGSQNFDWRSLAHIQEMGVHAVSRVLGAEVMEIYESDWTRAAGGVPPPARPFTDVTTTNGDVVSLVASPQGFLPDEASWELPRMVAMLDTSRQSVELQVLTYKTKERNGAPFPTLDEALRRAAARGVHVRVIVSDWSSKPGSDGRAALEDLSKSPNIEIRILTIPKFSGGDIPFARVAHAKYLVVDNRVAWVGSSNWEGDYFTKTRNVGVIMQSPRIATRLDGVFGDGWALAAPLTAAGVAPSSGTGPVPP